LDESVSDRKENARRQRRPNGPSEALLRSAQAALTAASEMVPSTEERRAEAAAADLLAASGAGAVAKTAIGVAGQLRRQWLHLSQAMQGGSQDLAEARRLFGLAAAQGDAEAQGAIGQMHHLGDGADGGPKDLAEARRLYGLAAATAFPTPPQLGQFGAPPPTPN
jgi:TPR repeat protein